MTRYFMTIPEAVQLIIRAGSLSHGEASAGGEVFVLEMGDPVGIVDLAETMIRLSGLEPERDIAIEIVGARPGEKLHEDLFNPYERPQPTPAQKIVRAQRDPLDPAWVEQTFSDINLLVLEGDAAALAAARLTSRARARCRRSDLEAPGSQRRLPKEDGVDAARAVGAQLHIVGWRRRRFRLDHRTGDPDAALFRARERDVEHPP